MFHGLKSDDALVQIAAQSLTPDSPQDRDVKSKVMSDYDVLVRCFRRYLLAQSSSLPQISSGDDVLYRALMRVLEEVRFGIDRQRPGALNAWKQTQDLIVERAQSGRISSDLVLRILKLFQWAQVTVNEDLKIALSKALNELATLSLRKDDVIVPGQTLASFRLMMKSLAKEARANSVWLYLNSIDLLSFLSDDVTSQVAAAFVQSDIGVFRDTGLLALINPSPTVRKGVLTALKADLASMRPANMRRLGLIRPWLPTSSERDEVSMLLEDAYKYGLKPEPIKPVRMDWTYVSFLDGSGCQGISAASINGKSAGLYTFLNKIDFGIRSAIYESSMSVRHIDANERHLKRMGQPVSRDFVDAFACNALAESHKAGNAIPVEFVGVAEAYGATNWRPDMETMDTIREKLLSRVGMVDIQGALARTEDLRLQERFATWFEDGAFIDEALSADVNKKKSAQGGIEGVANNLLAGKIEERRERWQKVFFWSAAADAFSSKSKTLEWADRFFVSEALRQGTPLKDIPFFRKMAMFSVSHSTMRLVATLASGSD